MENSLCNYVIGVDGGATKTVAALADLRGRILKTGESGSSSPRNIGIKGASKNVAGAIKKVLRKKGRILSTFIGLPSIEEEYKSKKKAIQREILKQKVISAISQGKLIIGSDQLAAFRTGTNEKDGILLIAGTGGVAHGWRKNREEKTSGWGWLADEMAAFWVGQKVFQAIFKALDGRESKTLLTKIVFQELKVKSAESLLLKVYSQNPTKIIPLFSVFCDKAAKKGDRVAKKIMTEAGREATLSVNTVTEKLGFRRQKFPLVLVGGMFKSKIFLDAVVAGVKKFSPRVNIIKIKGKPVKGAVRVAIENIGK